MTPLSNAMSLTIVLYNVHCHVILNIIAFDNGDMSLLKRHVFLYRHFLVLTYSGKLFTHLTTGFPR